MRCYTSSEFVRRLWEGGGLGAVHGGEIHGPMRRSYVMSRYGLTGREDRRVYRFYCYS